MSLKHGVVALVVILCAGLIQACMDDADAQTSGGSTISRAEFDALAAQVAALEANQPGDKVFAGSGSSAQGSATLQKAVTAGGKALGTAMGFLPADVPSYQSRLFSLKSSNGYLYAVPNEPNANGVVGIGGLGSSGGIVPLYYAASGCAGQGYVASSDLSDYGALQGVVFRLHAGEFNATVDDPAQYFYVAAGTARVNSFAYLSQTSNIGKCTEGGGTLPAAFPSLSNDTAVTGVDSAPVPTPVTLEAPAGA